MKHQRYLLGSALGLLVSAIVATSSPAAAEDLQMWERSGGNAGVVDRLVAMWNEENPDRKITLTYIPHAEMVAKLAQAMAKDVEAWAKGGAGCQLRGLLPPPTAPAGKTVKGPAATKKR